MFKITNKKKIFKLLILVGLIATLFAFQKPFNKKIKQAMIVSNNTNNLKEYSFYNDKYAYSLPENWAIEEREFPGNYILEHKNFKSEDLGITGFVQLINTENKIEYIVNLDKEKLDKSIEDYKKEDWTYKGKNGVKVSYSKQLVSGKKFLVNTYYLTIEENKHIKVSFDTEENSYKDNLNSIFESILDSIYKK